jgi:hypothetical protein
VLGEHALPPRGKTTLKIVYDTKDRSGTFRKIVTISTDIPGQEEIEVTVEGTVGEAPGAKIQVNPRKALLGVLAQGSSVKQEFTITNTGDHPLTIAKVSSRGIGHVFFDGLRDGNMVIDPGTSRKLELQMQVRDRPGQVQELIVFESNAKNAPKSGYVVIIQYSVSKE